MMFKASSMKGYAIQASDGLIGTVSDLLFDDRSWKIRWLVIDTGSFLPGRRVLIHPSAIGQAVHDQEELLVSLSKAQIEASPDIASDQPVSAQMEAHLNDYYGWDPYWGSLSFGHGAIASPLSPPPLIGADLPDEAAVAAGPRNEGDPHLRSVQACLGYGIVAIDGAIGHAEDFQADDRAWEIRYLIVDTRKWWSGAHVLISPYAILGIDWAGHSIRVELTQSQVRASPPWNPASAPDLPYEAALHHHYGWQGYGWDTASDQPGQGPVPKLPAALSSPPEP